MRYVFIDIETTNEQLDFEIDKSELIELWAFDINTQKTFSCCVKVNYSLSEFTKRLTGIQDKDIKEWKEQSLAIQEFINFLWNKDDLVVIWHNIEWFDIPVLWRYSDFFKDIKYLDTLQLFQLFFPWLEQYSVEFLFKYFFDNNEYKEEHRALQDSIDEAKLFEKCINKNFIKIYREKQWKNLDFLNLLRKKNKNIKNQTKNELSEIKDNKDKDIWNNFMENNHIYDYIQENILYENINIDEYLWKKWKISKKKVFEKFFKSFDYEKLKKTKYNYEELKETNEDEITEIYQNCLWEKKEREWQKTIINNLNNIFNWKRDQKVNWIEAWTGIWKTYWYLIPSMNFLQKNPKYKVFVSTYTKVLQWQIMKEDIHNLWNKFNKVNHCHLKANSEGFDLNNIPFTWKKITLFHLMMLTRIQRWNYYASDLHYGIVIKLNHFEGTNYIYNSFSTTPNIDYNKEFWFKWFLQSQIHNNNLFVVNHHFILSQFWWFWKDKITWYYEWIEKVLNYKYYMLLDEWHNMESVMRDFFTIHYDIETFEKIIDFMIPWWKNKINIFNLFKNERTKLYEEIENNHNKLRIPEKEYEQLKEHIEKKSKSLIDKVQDKNLQDYKTAVLWAFQTTDLYRIAQIDIRDLRERYSMEEVNYKKIDLYKRYFKNWDNQFNKILNILFSSVEELWKEYKELIIKLYQFIEENKIWSYDITNNMFLKQIRIIYKYLKKWKDFLSSFNWWDSFIEWFVQFKEWIEEIKNFWFKMILKDISKWNKVFEESEWVCFLSATLSDSTWSKSYILNEIAQWQYKQFESLKSPFDYSKNRKIIIPELNIDDESEMVFMNKANIVLKYVKKYWWKTLILTTSNKDKDKIANFLYKELNWEWIMIKKHEWWTMNSRTNKKNIQSMIDNPETVLVWSKSYMEWVDIPGENLSLVVLWKLPFLPPIPFLEYQNNKPEYKKTNPKYVYQFLCAISFRQAIWRLIRTKNDKWEILILDPRIKDNSWYFFDNYRIFDEIGKDNKK